MNVSATAHTMMEANDRIPRDRGEALYASGRDAASKVLETWSFDAYISEYREGKTHSRREQLTQQLQKEAAIAS